MNGPKLERVRAIDVVPYAWGLWCSVDGSPPFVNEICCKGWTEDGERVSFMLDSHNFLVVDPLEELELVRITDPYVCTYYKHDEWLASRPGGERKP